MELGAEFLTYSTFFFTKRFCAVTGLLRPFRVIIARVLWSETRSQVFSALDADNSGSVDYRELCRRFSASELREVRQDMLHRPVFVQRRSGVQRVLSDS